MTMTSEDVIEKMEVDVRLLDEIMRWAVASGHDKRYKKCTAGLSDACLKVDAMELFHGKHCAECRAVYKNQKYLKSKSKKSKGSSEDV